MINLRETSEAIDRIIRRTKQNHQKAICFITGVPGSGKTLAGLNIANQRLQTNEDEHAVFLSGNGPLVRVLQEALIRDEMSRGVKRQEAKRNAVTFIQNIHNFRDEYTISSSIPHERVVIFDEAQRAWTREMTASFMRRKRGINDFTMSEPEFLISVMDRHLDWAVIICLVGGGQEINTGEAGLPEWFSALKRLFPSWKIYCSQQINDSEYIVHANIGELLSGGNFVLEERLHLAVSIRSYRSEKVSALIKSILDNDLPNAKYLYSEISKKYPICLTRNIEKAKNWIRQKARGSERFGLLASSGATRLRPEGIYVNAEIEVEHWFLDDRLDVRSSFSLEGVATEFDIQGLELDWAIVAWDADLRYYKNGWIFKSFKGNKWLSVNDPIRQLYLKNAYRVLLSRARQGMVVFVPKGDKEDFTHLPEYYNEIYTFLQQVGFEEI